MWEESLEEPDHQAPLLSLRAKFSPSSPKVPSPSENSASDLGMSPSPQAAERSFPKPGRGGLGAQTASVPPSCSTSAMSRTDSHPGRGLAGCWRWGSQPRLLLPTVPISRLLWLLLLLLASLLPSAWPASPLPREEEIVFPEKLNGSVFPGLGAPARLLYRLPAFGEVLLLELEQDPGVRVEGLTVQYLGQAPELLGGAEPGTYLTGTINGDPESVASLHWDGGSLLGVLQYRGTELHIQPLEGGTPNSAGGPGAHILRRKSPASGQGPMCNVKAPPGNLSSSPRRAKVGSPGVCVLQCPPAMSVLLTPIHFLSTPFHFWPYCCFPPFCLPLLFPLASFPGKILDFPCPNPSGQTAADPKGWGSQR